MRSIVACLFVALGVGCTQPTRLLVTSELPTQVLSLAPIQLPKVTVLGYAGTLADEPVTLSLEPLGIAELRNEQLLPRSRGKVTITWKTRNGIKKEHTIDIQLVDEVNLRCLPSCRAVVGQKLTIQATAYANGQPQLQLPVPLRTDDPTILKIDGDDVVALRPGTVRLVADLDGVIDSRTIEVRPVADGVELQCPTIFTKTKIDENSDIDVCYVTKGTSLQFRSSALANTTRTADERINWEVLNTKIADVSSSGKVVAIASGQTTLKASLASAPHIFRQISVYVDEPRAIERLVRSIRMRVYRDAYSGFFYRYGYYKPQCKNHKNYFTKAFAYVGGRSEPVNITCESSEAVACAADAAHGLKVWGLSSSESLRSWLGPCCCITEDDRKFMDMEETRRFGVSK